MLGIILILDDPRRESRLPSSSDTWPRCCFINFRFGMSIFRKAVCSSSKRHPVHVVLAADEEDARPT